MGLLKLLGFGKKEETSQISESELWLDEYTTRHARLMRQQVRYNIACLSQFNIAMSESARHCKYSTVMRLSYSKLS